MNPTQTVKVKFRRGSSARNKLLFILGLVVLLSIGTVFALATDRALFIRSVTSSEFNQYVIDHNLGTAEESSDFSGFQGDFCVLHLRHTIPQATVRDTVVKLLYEYHTLDGGTHLTVDYQADQKSTKNTVVLADAIYDQSSGTVSLNLHDGVQKGLFTIPVKWTNSWYNN